MKLQEALLNQAKTDSSEVVCTIFSQMCENKNETLSYVFFFTLSFIDIQWERLTHPSHVIYTFNFCIVMLVSPWLAFSLSIIKV